MLYIYHIVIILSYSSFTYSGNLGMFYDTCIMSKRPNIILLYIVLHYKWCVIRYTCYIIEMSKYYTLPFIINGVLCVMCYTCYIIEMILIQYFPVNTWCLINLPIFPFNSYVFVYLGMIAPTTSINT